MLVVPLSLIFCLSVQRLGNPKMSIVYHGAPIHINTYATLYSYTILRLTHSSSTAIHNITLCHCMSLCGIITQHLYIDASANSITW